jgi:hypothetical protein
MAIMGGEFLEEETGPVREQVTAGRDPHRIIQNVSGDIDLSFKAVAAPAAGACAFPDQALLFAPALWLGENPRGLVSVEDIGGDITCENYRIDVYVGVHTRSEALVINAKWKDLVWHSVWPYVELDKPLTNECDIPETIENVRIKAGIGARVVY